MLTYDELRSIEIALLAHSKSCGKKVVELNEKDYGYGVAVVELKRAQAARTKVLETLSAMESADNFGDVELRLGGKK